MFDIEDLRQLSGFSPALLNVEGYTTEIVTF